MSLEWRHFQTFLALASTFFILMKTDDIMWGESFHGYCPRFSRTALEISQYNFEKHINDKRIQAKMLKGNNKHTQRNNKNSKTISP